jgi:hypothetical protein
VAEEVEAVVVLAPEAAQAPRPARVQPCPSPVLERATTMVPASRLPALTVAARLLVVAARQRRGVAARQVEVRCPHRWPPGLLALKAGYCMRPR